MENNRVLSINSKMGRMKKQIGTSGTGSNVDSLSQAYLTVADIRRYLNVSQAKAYELTHRKDFPVCRLGGSIRIPRTAFLAWVDQQTYWPDTLPPVA